MTSRLALQGVGDIKRDEAKICAFASTMGSMAMSKKGRKVMRLANDDKLDEAVYAIKIDSAFTKLRPKNVVIIRCFTYPAISLIQLVLGPTVAG